MKELLFLLAVSSLLLVQTQGQSAVGVTKCVTECQKKHCPLHINQQLEECVLKHQNNADRYDCGKELDIPTKCTSCASDCASVHVYNVCKQHVANYRATMLKAMLQMNSGGTDAAATQQAVPPSGELDGPK